MVTLTRGLLLFIRGIPELIFAVIFVAAMGLGPVPGTLALTIATATFMAKLIGDALEEVQQAPREGVSATGASRLQEFISAVLPQALPNLVSQSLYMLDVNLRSSTVLGGAVIVASVVWLARYESAQQRRARTPGRGAV